MAAKSWAHAVSGNWTTSADWSGGTPTTADAVTIGLVGNYTVTINSTVAFDSLVFNAPGAQLVETSTGSIDIAHGFEIDNGTVILNGVNTSSTGYQPTLVDGEIDIGNSGALPTGIDMRGGLLLATTSETISGIYINGTTTMAAVDGATVVVENAGYITGGKTTTLGVLGDDGTIVWTGGFGTSGGSSGTAILDIAFGTLKGGDNLFGQLFGGYQVTDIDQGATVDLAGANVTVTGLGGGGSLINSGAPVTLTLAGAGNFYGSLTGQLALDVTASTNLGSCDFVGSTTVSAGATLTVEDGFKLNTDDGVTGADATAAFVNNYDSLFAKVGGTGTSTISTAFTNEGTVQLLSGNLSFTAGLTNNGTLDVQVGQVVVTSNGFDNEGVVHGLISYDSGTGTYTITANAPGQSTWFGSNNSDTFSLPGAATYVSGGGGFDTIELTGNATFVAGSVVSVEQFNIENGVTANLSALHTAEYINLQDSGGTVSVTGTQAGDIFRYGSGVDTINGAGGNDLIDMGQFFTASDKVDGGAGTDTVQFGGNYSGAGALTLGATTMVNVERLLLVGGFNYTVTTNDANVAAGQRLTVDASALALGTTLIFNGAAETNGAFTFLAGAGANTLTGGAGADFFSFAPGSFGTNDTVNGGAGTALDRITFTTAANVTAAAFAHVSHVEQLFLFSSSGVANSVTLADAMVGGSDDSHRLSVYGGTGNDTVNASALTATNRVFIQAGSGNDTFTGGAGSDTFAFATADFNASDHVNGGTGTGIDSLDFTTAGTVSAAALAGVSHIERILFAAGNHTITLSDALVTSADDGRVLTLVGNSGTDTFVASSVTTAANSVRFEGLGGADKFTFGTGGTETAIYTGVADSTGNAAGTLFDSFVHFRAATDKIDLPTADKPTGVSSLTDGTWNNANSFDTNMANIVGPSLAAHEAVVLHETAGTFAGHDFLVVNPTGTAGYLSGHDYVFDITGYTGTVATSTFI